MVSYAWLPLEAGDTDWSDTQLIFPLLYSFHFLLCYLVIWSIIPEALQSYLKFRSSLYMSLNYEWMVNQSQGYYFILQRILILLNCKIYRFIQLLLELPASSTSIVAIISHCINPSMTEPLCLACMVKISILKKKGSSKKIKLRH